MSKKDIRQYRKEKLNALIKETVDSIMQEIINPSSNEQWEMPWKGVISVPHNYKTKHIYSGFNYLKLMSKCIANGWADYRFVSHKQMYKIKGTDGKRLFLKEEEMGNGVTVLKPKVIEVKVKKDEVLDDDPFAEVANNQELFEDENDALLTEEEKTEEVKEENVEQAEEEEKTKKIVYFIPYTVYNANQFTNFPSLEEDFKVTWEDHEVVEKFIKSSGIEYKIGAQGVCMSKVDKDGFLTNSVIYVPPKGSFDNPADFYATLLHEWYHATGAKEFEGRIKSSLASENPETDKALEEIRAETFAMVVCKILGLQYSPQSDSLAYIKHFVKNINDDNKYKEVYKAIVEACKMVDVFVDFMFNRQPKPEWFPSKDKWETLNYQEVNLPGLENKNTQEDRVKDNLTATSTSEIVVSEQVKEEVKEKQEEKNSFVVDITPSF